MQLKTDLTAFTFAFTHCCKAKRLLDKYVQFFLDNDSFTLSEEINGPLLAGVIGLECWQDSSPTFCPGTDSLSF